MLSNVLFSVNVLSGFNSSSSIPCKIIERLYERYIILWILSFLKLLSWSLQLLLPLILRHDDIHGIGLPSDWQRHFKNQCKLKLAHLWSKREEQENGGSHLIHTIFYFWDLWPIALLHTGRYHLSRGQAFVSRLRPGQSLYNLSHVICRGMFICMKCIGKSPKGLIESRYSFAC